MVLDDLPGIVGSCSCSQICPSALRFLALIRHLDQNSGRDPALVQGFGVCDRRNGLASLALRAHCVRLSPLCGSVEPQPYRLTSVPALSVTYRDAYTRIFRTRKKGDSPLGTVPSIFRARCSIRTTMQDDAQLSRRKSHASNPPRTTSDRIFDFPACRGFRPNSGRSQAFLRHNNS